MQSKVDVISALRSRDAAMASRNLNAATAYPHAKATRPPSNMFTSVPGPKYPVITSVPGSAASRTSRCTGDSRSLRAISKRLSLKKGIAPAVPRPRRASITCTLGKKIIVPKGSRQAPALPCVLPRLLVTNKNKHYMSPVKPEKAREAKPAMIILMAAPRNGFGTSVAATRSRKAANSTTTSENPRDAPRP